ncbi:putative holliday junction resolvase [Candidatus Kinetoplastibacterium desouzaii TCC079E]|uniref:Putative pre-16S rRNA nuclease n=1 Tax=Candidatus Kinetoplastidibacterium desouzai TCC079E TaxID=1208919 RepID=M1LN84_9PROT|nr:Holliday junction resolvase RuvX [Candidatus Kinetoplastibacterium desouzaii]AGF47172.1 putative holliday junction resolvase [Candidatus Kinetoplastibacterium desouzaii TCC079E]
MLQEVLLSFDYGTKKIGVGIGNTFSFIAKPLEIIFCKNNDFFARIGFLIKYWDVRMVIVGHSLDLDRKEQEITGLIYHFADQLIRRFGVKVEFVDESYSSIEAQQIVKNGNDDAIAAAIILQRYLDDLYFHGDFN